MSMAGNVWVVAESWRGAVSDASHEALALGRSLADALGVSLEAILLGHGSSGLAGSLDPADSVLSVEHPTLADASGLQASRAIAALASERSPPAILGPATHLPTHPAWAPLESEDPDAGDVDVTQQEVLIGVGRGISGEANLEVAEDL